MAKSLQEQLRQAGLASQKQAVKARKAKNTKEKMQRKGVNVVDETAELVSQRDAEKRARDQELNAQRDQAALHKAIQAQIGQLIDLNAITERGELEFRFDHDGVIRTLMLNAPVRTALINGTLAIVGRSEALHIVPSAVARKIDQRDASWLILLNETNRPADEDDEYAQYEVPDDLMW
ncbi:MAG: DUF2058 domain-containing protein [Granulosicoccus sp.]|nr:DUF2058 domain-containing protein [Granulosicoccus sp.]